jgi:hypothetical protein
MKKAITLFLFLHPGHHEKQGCDNKGDGCPFPVKVSIATWLGFTVSNSEGIQNTGQQNEQATDDVKLFLVKFHMIG